MSLLLSVLYYLTVCLINSTHPFEIPFSSLHVISCGAAVDRSMASQMLNSLFVIELHLKSILLFLLELKTIY